MRRGRTAATRAGLALAIFAVSSLGALAQPASSQVDAAQKQATDVAKARPQGSTHTKPSTQPVNKRAVLAIPDVAASELKMTIAGMTMAGDRMRTTIAFAISGRGRLRVFTTQEPPQLIVEGADLGFASDLAQLTPAGPHLVADYRFGLADPTTGRIVLDLQRSAKIASADRLPAGLTVELHASDAAAPGEPIVVDLTDPGVVATSMPARPQHRRPVVVIDPGHGGRDPGAVADGSILEKDVVLAVAKRLVGSLSALQRFDVRMTRDADTSVSLDQRLAFSRLAQADLFLSLHADTFAGQPQAAVVRGGSVYVLADRASNRSAAALAEKENAADLRLGADFGLSSGNAAIDGILSDLTSRETQAFASDAQAGLVRSLKGVIQLARDPSRGAAFKVLKQAETPAVLIELGYLSHAQDIALLQSADWQSRVATAITRAIEGYFSDKRSVLSTK